MKTILLSFAALAVSAPGLLAYPFTAPVTLRAGFGRVAGVADFNRDGQADVLMASADQLVWLRHTSGTAFTQAALMSWTGQGIDEVLTPDIDGDGDTDVVLNTTSPSKLIILRNDGNFVFAKVLEAAVPDVALVAGAVVGDYDNDGDLDAGLFHLVTGDIQRHVTWAENTAGAFALAAPAQDVGGINWYLAVTADFNRDGFMDLMMGDPDVTTLRGTRSGVFLPWPDVTFTGLITHMETGDIDRDGFPDIVLTSGSAATTPQRSAWCRWNGAGFNAPATIQNRTTGQLRGTHLMDVDEDGDLDAVFGDQAFYVNSGNQAAHQIVWAENSAGSFLISKVLLDAQQAEVILSGDVDGDGDADLVFSAGGDVLLSQNTAIHRTAEFGEFRFSAASSSVGDMTTADMNNDGTDDLLWSLPVGSGIVWNSGYTQGTPPGAGAFTSFSNAALLGAGALAGGDLNHDGLTDVVVAARGTNQLVMALAGSAGMTATNIFALPAGTTDIVLADVTQDNLTDILIGHATGVTLLRNNGASSPTWTPENVVSGIGPVTKVRTVQLNGSGRPEIMAMTVETSPARCRIYRLAWAPGFGLWASSGVLWEGDSASSLLAVGDANRDNANDVFYSVTNALLCAPSTLTSSVPGTPKTIAAGIAGMRSAETADFNNDGITDLVAAQAGSVMLFTGLGNGSFKVPVGLFSKAGAAFTRLAVYDFQKDGDMDIAVLDSATNEIHLLYNNCGQFDLVESGLGDPIATAASAAPLAMRLTFLHGGQTGDAAASIRNLRFRLRRADTSGGQIVPGIPLTNAESTALISAVEVYNDAGELFNFESGTDLLLGTTGGGTSVGYLTVTPTVPIALAYNQTVSLWVRLRLTATAATSGIRNFYLEHITDPAAAGTMVAHAGLTSSNFRLDPMLIDEAAARFVIPGALENWRFTNWGQYDGIGPAANDADPDGDGMANLMEYINSQNPTVPGGVGFGPVVGLSFDSGADAMIADLRLLNSYDSRVKLTLQSSASLAAWSLLSTRTGTGAWTGIAPYSTTALSGGRTRFGFNGGFDPSFFKKGYFRLKAEELP